MLSVDAILSVRRRRQGQGGRYPSPVSRPKSAKTREHHRRVCRGWAELFEARKAKGRGDHRGKIAGTIRLRPRLQEQASHLDRADGQDRGGGAKYLIPKGKHIHLQDGDIVEKGRFHRRGQSGTARHPGDQGHRGNSLPTWSTRSRRVYRLQGVLINDKHIGGDCPSDAAEGGDHRSRARTDMISGEQIDKIEFDQINVKAKERGQEARHGERRFCSASPRRACRPVSLLLGGVRFQETTRVAHRSRRQRQRSIRSRGLKENVIVGPADTGGQQAPPMAKIREGRGQARQADPGRARRKQAAIVPSAPGRPNRWRCRRRSDRTAFSTLANEKGRPRSRPAFFLGGS